MKQYTIELVTKDYPYICLGYVKSDSVTSGVLNITSNVEDAMVVCDESTMNSVFDLISAHNKNGVRVMDWITELGSTERLFNNEITW